MLIGITAVVAAVLAAVICALTDAYASMAWLWLLPVSFAGGFAILAGLVFLLLWVSCALVRTDVPQEKDSPYYRRFAELVIEAVMMVARVKVHTRGLEKTPKEGRFLLVCNHLGDADPAILLHFFRKSQIAFVSKRENRTKFIVGKIMHKIMCPLINRENDREALKTILHCIQLLKDDKVSIGVFPEGYVHEDRKFHHFRHGVFKIAQKAKVPIVVCTIQETQHVFKNFAKLKPSEVHLHLLEVISAEELAGKTTVEIGEQIHAMMAADLGPKYMPANE